jgi:protein TonB
MQIKKYPNAVLENYSKIFIQLGLVLSLFIVYELVMMKSYSEPVKGLSGSLLNMEDDEESIIIIPKEVPVKPPAKTVLPDIIVQVDDQIEMDETLLESTETDESEAISFTIESEISAVVEEEEIIEDVPFIIIEEVPIFPGCKGNRQELRTCFSAQVKKFIQKKFNLDLASELGLEQGTIQKIMVLFVIDKQGYISDIKARAPHVRLQEEAIRVINLLPKMEPGKQRGRAIAVKYALPIVFQVN